MNVQITGLKEVMGKLDKGLLAVPWKNFLTRSVVKVQGAARINTPVDNSFLRNKLMYGVTPQEGKVGFLEAREGTDLFYQARAMEYGTGTRGDPQVSHKAGHFPPPASLDRWAARHGFASGFIVARAIARKGGLKARRMLRDGLHDSMSAIQGFAKTMEREIKAEWDK